MTGPLWVVVVHWNHPEACARTIARIRDEALATHVVLVDNGSDPGAVTELADLADTVVETGRNIGFGPGANAGLRLWLDQSDAEWCAVLPHDALPAPGVLTRLVCEGERHAEAGLVCADVGDGAAPRIDPRFGPMPGPAGVAEGFETVDYPHGTLLVIRRDCARTVGLFDERYFAYCEEADLGIRARAAGWTVGLVRGARVDNPGQQSHSALVDYLMLRNTIALLRRHHGTWNAMVRTAIAAGQLVSGLVRPRRRSPWFDARARVLAIGDAWRGRLGPPPPSLFR